MSMVQHARYKWEMRLTDLLFTVSSWDSSRISTQHSSSTRSFPLISLRRYALFRRQGSVQETHRD